MSVVVDCILVVEVDRARVGDEVGISSCEREVLGVLSMGPRLAPRFVPLDGWELEMGVSRYPIRDEIYWTSCCTSSSTSMILSGRTGPVPLRGCPTASPHFADGPELVVIGREDRAADLSSSTEV
jgi:hypothetical protein